MSNLVFYFWLILVGVLINLRIADNDFFNLGFFIFLWLVALNGLRWLKTIFQRVILGSVLVLGIILITGEILYLNGIRTFIFDTVEYNWYFWIQIGYIFMIAPLIGIYYEKKS